MEIFPFAIFSWFLQSSAVVIVVDCIGYILWKTCFWSFLFIAHIWIRFILPGSAGSRQFTEKTFRNSRETEFYICYDIFSALTSSQQPRWPHFLLTLWVSLFKTALLTDYFLHKFSIISDSVSLEFQEALAARSCTQDLPFQARTVSVLLGVMTDTEGSAFIWLFLSAVFSSLLYCTVIVMSICGVSFPMYLSFTKY